MLSKNKAPIANEKMEKNGLLTLVHKILDDGHIGYYH